MLQIENPCANFLASRLRNYSGRGSKLGADHVPRSPSPARPPVQRTRSNRSVVRIVVTSTRRSSPPFVSDRPIHHHPREEFTLRDLIKTIFQNAGHGPSELNSGLPHYRGEQERAERFFKTLYGPHCVRKARRRTARVFAVHTSEHLLMDEDDTIQMKRQL